MKNDKYKNHKDIKVFKHENENFKDVRLELVIMKKIICDSGTGDGRSYLQHKMFGVWQVIVTFSIPASHQSTAQLPRIKNLPLFHRGSCQVTRGQY